VLQNLSREIRVLGMIRRRTIIAALILRRMRSGASCSNIAELSGKITVAKHLATLLALVVELTVDTGTETKWREIMDIRSAAAAAVLLGLALTFASWPAAAQQWTPQQRAACEPDAMRLCQQYISDIGRVRACMSHYRRYLSPACRAEFEGGAKKKARRFR